MSESGTSRSAHRLMFFNKNNNSGSVTDRLAKIFQWDEQIVRMMKQEIKAKNPRLHDRGLIKEFFKFPETFRPSDYQRSNTKMAIENGRYYRLMVAETANVELSRKFWNDQVLENEIQLVKKMFHHVDSDLAVITSELGDLHLTGLGTMEDSKRDEPTFSNPVSHFSELECFKRAEQNLEDDPDLRKKLEDMEKALQSSNNWTHQQLSTQFRASNAALFRFDSGNCVGYDWKIQQFCQEPVIPGNNKCMIHVQEGNDLKMIREMGTLVSKKGISLAQGITRLQVGPEKLDNMVEYAPSSEGAAPAFRHSMDSLEKILEASDASYKTGYLLKMPYFEAKEFKQRFPNAKSINDIKWKHAYLAMMETMKSYAFNLETNWTRYIPFLLGKLGIYQGWINSEEIMDQKKFISAKYDYKPLGVVADILKDVSQRAKPIAPALLYDTNLMDGTSTPSTQSTDKDGKCWSLNQEDMVYIKVRFKS